MLNNLNVKSLILPLTTLLCVLGIVGLQKQYLNLVLLSKNNLDSLKEQSEQTIAIEAQKKLPAFGFSNLIADWNYLKFCQYFGDTEARQVTGYPLVTDYFELIVKHDPHFVKAYLALSSANSLFAAQPEKTVAFMNTVLDKISPQISEYSFLLWTYKATDEILFLADLQAAQKSYEQAAKWAEIQDDDAGKEIANRYRQTAKFLSGNPDSVQAQISAWVTVLSSSQDNKTKQHAISKIKNLGGDVIVNSNGQVKIKVPEKV
jgi:hypothetical protein